MIDLSEDTKREAFFATEYNALRREIELHIVERRKIEGQTFIGLAAVYAWVLTRTPPLDPVFMKASLAIPMVFSFLGFLRWIALMIRTVALGDYIRNLEVSVAGEGRGWETALKKMREDRPVVGKLEGWVEAVTWILTVVGTTVAFFYVFTSM